jgi:hypothetical protein
LLPEGSGKHDLLVQNPTDTLRYTLDVFDQVGINYHSIGVFWVTPLSTVDEV